MRDDADADHVLADAGRALADGIERAVPVWVSREVERILVAFHGEADEPTMAKAADAGRRAAAEIGPKVRAIVEADVDDQRVNPLTLLREAVHHPTAVLAEAGVPGVVRDEFAEEHFPDDAYGLTPMAFADVDESLHEFGIVWGAAKARAHMRRHRPTP